MTHISLMPHPPLLVPSVSQEALRSVKKTKDAMETLAQRIKKREPRLIILSTPHAPAEAGRLAVYRGERLQGNFRQFGSMETVEVFSDQAFQRTLMRTLSLYGINTVSVDEPLDHGALVPLKYLCDAGVGAPVIVIGQYYGDYAQNHRVGHILRSLLYAEETVGELIISGDLSHALKENGPMGYHPSGKVFDETLQKALKHQDLDVLKTLDDQVIVNAMSCIYRGIGMVEGLSANRFENTEVLSYEGPFGVGYLVGALKCAENLSLPAIARRSIESVFLNDTFKALKPSGDHSDAPCFVTLKKDDQLRGCIGTLEPTGRTLTDNVITYAKHAAFDDPRFPPLRRSELCEITISVDIIHPPVALRDFKTQDPKVDGLIAQKEGRQSVLLPGIEGIHTAQAQRQAVLKKGGFDSDADVVYYTFRITRVQE